jgi:hypothetical protein
VRGKVQGTPSEIWFLIHNLPIDTTPPAYRFRSMKNPEERAGGSAKVAKDISSATFALYFSAPSAVKI